MLHLNECFWSLANHKKILFKCIGLSLISHQFGIFAFYILTSPFFGKELALLDIFTFIPMGMMVVAVPISPSGMGVGHAAFEKLFELLYLFPTIAGLENIFRNKYVDYATHIFDSFGLDRGGFLERQNFCPNQSNYYSELFNVFLPVEELFDEEINYVEKVVSNNTTYLHQIYKIIEHELPGVSDMDIIGPFPSNEESCKDFGWLNN